MWQEFFQASHRTFVHIDVQITDMKQGEAIKGAVTFGSAYNYAALAHARRSSDLARTSRLI
jgi:hypothetical protein